MPGPMCSAATAPAAGSALTARCALPPSSCRVPSGRSSSMTIIPATSAGMGSWPTRPDSRPTPPTRAPGRPARARRCARGSSTAVAAAGRCRPATTGMGVPPTSVLPPAPIRRPHPAAARWPRPPWTRRSLSGCLQRSTLRRSHWRWPPPPRSPTAKPAPPELPSSPSNAPATRPTGPSGGLWPASRRTAWWHAAWRSAGEAKLVTLAEAEQALAATQAKLTPLPQPAELEALTSDLPRLWRAPTTQAKDRKRMLRTLIADVTVLPEPDRAKLRLVIRWHSGATDELLTSRRPSAITLRRTPAGAVELLQRLGSERDDAELAEELNATGYLTGAGRPFDVKAVRWLRHVHHMPPPATFQPGELSVAEVAQRLGISAGAVYYWVQHDQLAAGRTPSGRWCVPFGPEVEAACRQKIASSAHLTPPTPTAPAGGAV